VGLLQCRLFSLRHAFEGALRESNVPPPDALLRVHQLLPLHTVQLGYPFAFLSLAQPRLLRGCELPLFVCFEIAVFDDSIGFTAIDDGVGFARTMCLAFEVWMRPSIFLAADWPEWRAAYPKSEVLIGRSRSKL
jgi:hypothetical protein